MNTKILKSGLITMLMVGIIFLTGCGPSYQFNKAKKMDKEGKVEKAFRIYEKIIKKYPDTEWAKKAEKELAIYTYYGRGYNYMSKKSYDEAISEYKKILELDPNHANAHWSIGNCLSCKKLYDSAIKEYRKAIELDSQHINARYNIGVIYFNKGEFDKAIQEFQFIIDNYPNCEKYQDSKKHIDAAKANIDAAKARARKIARFKTDLANAMDGTSDSVAPGSGLGYASDGIYLLSDSSSNINIKKNKAGLYDVSFKVHPGVSWGERRTPSELISAALQSTTSIELIMRGGFQHGFDFYIEKYGIVYDWRMVWGTNFNEKNYFSYMKPEQINSITLIVYEKMFYQKQCDEFGNVISPQNVIPKKVGSISMDRVAASKFNWKNILDVPNETFRKHLKVEIYE